MFFWLHQLLVVQCPAIDHLTEETSVLQGWLPHYVLETSDLSANPACPPLPRKRKAGGTTLKKGFQKVRGYLLEKGRSVAHQSVFVFAHFGKVSSSLRPVLFTRFFSGPPQKGWQLLHPPKGGCLVWLSCEGLSPVRTNTFEGHLRWPNLSRMCERTVHDPVCWVGFNKNLQKAFNFWGSCDCFL